MNTAKFEKATGNLIVNCIDPGDWAQMKHIIDTAMKENKEYAVRYRMRKRDGSYIWVSDIGKKSWDEKGVPICIGVVRGYHRRGGDEAALGAGKPAKAATGRGIQPYF